MAAILFYNETLGGEFEFQKLYGMGDGLFNQVKKDYGTDIRVYAPVGEYKDLLAYLVRRLLENGANTSFVYNQEVLDPFVEMKKVKDNIQCYNHIYPNRKNSSGYDLTDPEAIDMMVSNLMNTNRRCSPVNDAIDILHKGHNSWSSRPFKERKELLLKYADVLEEAMVPANNLVHTAYKTYPNAIAEVREAVDFVRYYVEQAEKLYDDTGEILGYTGESNITTYESRGVWMVIAPGTSACYLCRSYRSSTTSRQHSTCKSPAPQTQHIAEVTLACMYG